MKTLKQLLCYLFNRRVTFISLFLFLISFKATAVNYYWIGGSGNWSDLSHWATTSGGTTLHTQIPTALDDVFFDANSFSAAGQIVSFDPLTILVRSINWTGAAHTPTMAGPAANLLKIYGSLTLVAGMNMNFGGKVNFEATITGQTVTMAGKTFNNEVVFNGIGGEWSFVDVFSTVNLLTLAHGVLNTNNQTVNAMVFFSVSTVMAPRTLNMGSSVFNLSFSGRCWYATSAATGLVINSGTSVINCTSNSLPSFEGGNYTYYDLNFTGASGSGAILDYNTFHDVNFTNNAIIEQGNTFHDVVFNMGGILEGNNTYNNVSFTAGYTYELRSNPATTQTINGTFTANGTCGALIDIHSSVPGAQATINHPAGVVNVSFVVLKDINAAGGAFTANNSVDLGNNTGWTFSVTGSQDLYWIGNGGNWDDGNHWSYTSGGAPSGCSPTPGNNVFFDANSFSSASQTVLINILTAYCYNMTWTGVTGTPTLNGPTTNLLKIYGSLTLVAGMNMNFAGKVNFEATTTGQTVTMAGKTFNNEVVFNGIGGEWSFADTFSIDNLLTLAHGILNTNNQTVNALVFFSVSTIMAPRTLNMGSSVFNLSSGGRCWYATSAATGLVINCGTSVVNCTANGLPSFDGGNFTYYDLNFTGASGTGSIIDYNTFHDVSFTNNGKIEQGNTFHDVVFNMGGIIQGNNTYNNVSFTAGYTYELRSNPATTQTINGTFTANGTCGALIDIHSSVPGAQATINHPAGVVNVSFVVLKDINATGGAFTANNSVDLGNNTGWTFSVTGSQDLYWIGNGGNWDDGNHWSYTSGGAPSGCSPTPGNNVFFDANSFSSASQTVLINIPTAYCRNMTWTGVTGTPTLNGPTTNLLKIYGSLTLVAGMNMNFAGKVNLEATTTGQTVTMAGKTFNNEVVFNGIGGEWSFADTFSTDNLLTLAHGILNTNNQTVNALVFFSVSTIMAPRTLNMGSSVFNLSFGGRCWYATSAATGLVINCGTSVVNCTANGLPSFDGGNFTYYDLNFTGASGTGSIIDYNTFHDVSFAGNGKIEQGNTFRDVVFNKNGIIQGNNTYRNLTFSAGFTYTLTSYTATSGTTQSINNHFHIQGSCTSYIVLQSSTPGAPAMINKVGDSVLGFNIHIQDIHCSGSAVFMAYNSVDLGGNTGWIFTTLPPLFDPDIVTGPSAVCSGATGVVYQTVPVSGAIYYQWTVPTGATIVGGQGTTTIIVNFGTAVSGDIVVETFNGCNYGVTGSVLTVVLGALTPTVTITANPTGPVCPETSITFTATATNTGGGTVNYNFKVNNISFQNGSSNTFATISLLNTDVVTCEITVGATSCSVSTTAVSNSLAITINSDIPANVSIEVNPGDAICSGDVATFTATANTSGGTAVYDFQVNGISVQSGNSNTYVTTNLSVGDNVTCLVSVEGNLCAAPGVSNSITIKDGCNYNCTPQIPNAFTPNGDGVNDKWVITKQDCFKHVDVFVYNRYGSLVYRKDNYQSDWQGMYKSKPVPDATYYYIVRGIMRDGRIEVYKGDLTILR